MPARPATPATGARVAAPPNAPLSAPLTPAMQAHLQHLEVEKRVAARTLALYRAALQTLAAAAQADGIEPAAAGAHDLRRWLGQQRERGLSPRSLALMLSAWRGFYRHGAQQGRFALNPADGLKPPKAPRLLPKALSVDQAMALADAGPHAAAREGKAAALCAARDQAMLELLYGCGLRVAELVGLDVRPPTTLGAGSGWVDLQALTVHVRGKGGKARSLPLGRMALAALQHWLAARPAWQRGDDPPALFLSRHGGRLSASQVRDRLAAQARAAGLPMRVHPHMLRHSFASHLLQSSGDLRGVQELLGHRSIASTQIYTKLDFMHLARIYDAAHPRARPAGAGGAAPEAARSPGPPPPHEDSL